MRTISALRTSAVAVVVMCLLVPRPAVAAAIHINDLAEQIAISWFGFDGNFTVNGNLYAGNLGSLLVDEGAPLTFSGNWSGSLGCLGCGAPDGNGIQSGGGNLFLIEGTGPVSDFTPVSDILTVGYARDVNNNTAAISGTFQSDLLEILGYYDLTNLPQYSAAVGEGGIIDAEGLLGVPGNLFIDVSSDSSEAPDVPEPSTLVLLGTGLLVAAPRLRRRLAGLRLL